MVPAESISNLESTPLFLTMSLNTPSAAGLLQIFPRQTNKTENDLASVSLDGPEEAIEGEIKNPGQELDLWVLLGALKGASLSREGDRLSGRKVRNWEYTVTQTGSDSRSVNTENVWSV